MKKIYTLNKTFFGLELRVFVDLVAEARDQWPHITNLIKSVICSCTYVAAYEISF